MRCSIRNFFWGESSREQKCNNNLHLTNLWVDSVCFLLSIVMLFMKASFGSLVVLVILWYWGPDKFLTYRYVMCKKGNHVLLYNFYLNGTYTNFLQMPHRIEMTLNIVWLFLENQSSNKLSERNYVGLKLSSKIFWKVSFAHCSKSSFFVQKFNFDFTRKIVKRKLGEKLVKMLGFCQNWIFGQKFDFPKSVYYMNSWF